MKVLLVNPSSLQDAPRMERAERRYDPPLAAIYLGSCLRQRGIECEIVDTLIDDVDLQKIEAGEYDLISFTVFIGNFLKNARDLTLRIRKINPTVPIVFGGVMASIFPDMILKEYPVDYIIRYEGENTLYELVEYLEGKRELSEIRGLSYRSGGQVTHNPPRYLENDLDAFPVPDWSLLGSKCNINQIPYYFSIITSRGCPFRCSFCYNRVVEDSILADSPTWRFRSADHVIQEIARIHSLTGTRVFTITDDNFLVNRKRGIAILDYLRNNKMYIEQCMAHMNNLKSSELIRAMSGVVQCVIYSLESASPRLLTLLDKEIDISLSLVINKNLFESGMTTKHHFIIGLPTETDDDLKMNVEHMKKLKAINPFTVGRLFLYLPLPFTPLEKYIIDNMGYSLPAYTIENFERASFQFEEYGKKYRPWLDEDRYSMLQDYFDVFTDVFQLNNMSVSEESLNKLDANPRLKSIFGDLEHIRKPPIKYFPYVLDRVLRGEDIDLKRDLLNKAEGL